MKILSKNIDKIWGKISFFFFEKILKIFKTKLLKFLEKHLAIIFEKK